MRSARGMRVVQPAAVAAVRSTLTDQSCTAACELAGPTMEYACRAACAAGSLRGWHGCSLAASGAAAAVAPLPTNISCETFRVAVGDTARSTSDRHRRSDGKGRGSIRSLVGFLVLQGRLQAPAIRDSDGPKLGRPDVSVRTHCGRVLAGRGLLCGVSLRVFEQAWPCNSYFDPGRPAC